MRRVRVEKTIQWNWPASYGEEQFTVILGGLHIEMASWKTVGDWLENSGWTDALVEANISSSGRADSFLKASHVSRTRYAHQVSTSCLYIMMQKAYKHYTEVQEDDLVLPFESWCAQRSAASPQFQYWSITFELELAVVDLVQSLRQGDFKGLSLPFVASCPSCSESPSMLMRSSCVLISIT